MFPLISKYAFDTKKSPIFCLDGYSTSYLYSVLYFVFHFILNLILPTILIIVNYILIMRKLKDLSKRLMSKKEATTQEVSINMNQSLNDESHLINSQNTRKEKRFATQFILMTISIVISSSVQCICTLRAVIPNFQIIFFYWRPVFRIIIIICFSFIPIISLYYNSLIHINII